MSDVIPRDAAAAGNSAPLLLASASPRRRELLSRLGVRFRAVPADVDEDGVTGRPEIVARQLARIKAEAARLLESFLPILAADTVVAIDGVLLGKPADPDEARYILRRLRGRRHQVVSAVALLPPDQRSAFLRHAVTQVQMRDYSDEEIEDAIARGLPFDKAGAYGIQDAVFHPVEAYEGCYCNVVGLPLWPTIELLRKAGIPVAIRPDRLPPECVACPLAPK
jgi:MAF protein